MRNIAADVECYRNYFLITVLDMKTGEHRHFDAHGKNSALSNEDRTSALRIITSPKHEIVTFNGHAYDAVMMEAAIMGWSTAKLKRLSDQLIVKKQRAWQMRQRANIKKLSINHVDLFWVTPMIASLKTYGARIHTKRLQDLPYHHDAEIKSKHVKVLRKYCLNDCTITAELFQTLSREIELRRILGMKVDIDLRSKSDAQIGEAILSKELGIKKQQNPSNNFWELWYKEAKNVNFRTKRLNELRDDIMLTPFYVTAAGYLRLAPEFQHDIVQVRDRDYKFGTGGLHSQEKCQAIRATKKVILEFIDVESFYPRIIINEKYAPSRVTQTAFTKVYQGIVSDRLKAKAAGNQNDADSLKITINGCFGKFGSVYSSLYDPQLVMQITITGQLYLLMLIEMLTDAGADIVTANTDGLVMRYKRFDERKIAKGKRRWEKQTRCTLASKTIQALYSRDVNNYIMLIDDKTTKRMGAYAEQSSNWHLLRKNPDSEVCSIAVVNYLRKRTPLGKTIRVHKNIRHFVVCKTIRGGAEKNGSYLGSTLRWYYAKGETGNIVRRDNGNQVPTSRGARPVQSLPSKLPKDVDYNWYIQKAVGILDDIGSPYCLESTQRSLI